MRQFIRHPVDVAQARVAWCQPHEHGYELGVTFLDAEDAFLTPARSR